MSPFAAMTPLPVPDGIQVERIACAACEGMGCDRQLLATCRSCGGPGIVDWVICPVHGCGVARSVRTGAFLTGCDGCQAEAARAILLIQEAAA